ncbi:MAG: tetratricopeptide repeat protein [Hydrogenophaga sp.]|uniref:tetratricopeptide repeat protein n=1 Tax=Hydrogenophaga sp. TaxID=1904254 RepID=UPI001D2789C2|nr:tetratricopeptide repeat protein [Hydrogenophaga sp.]MBX3610769.1 tetratricopeptide repeat protein [Hydrogenophaga sp.]
MKPRSSAAKPRRSLLTLLIAAALGLGGSAIAQTSAEPPVANSALDAMMFYQLLLGELNVQGGDPGSGYSLILDAARREKDPALFQRAVEIALQARSGESALAAAKAWSQTVPDDAQANRYVLQILLALNRAGETGPVLRTVLASVPPGERNDAINAIPQTYTRASDKAQVIAAVREALTPYLTSSTHGAAAWTTLGRLELANKRSAAAADAARKGHALDPASPYPAMLALELLEDGQADVEQIVRAQIDAANAAGQTDVQVPIGYARVLLDLQRLRDARVQLERLTNRAPRQLEPWLLLGSLQVQDRAWDAAQLSLQTYLDLAREANGERGRRGATQAYLLLAQIAEEQKDFATANAWLDRIDTPEDAIAVQARRASVLARQGRLPEARQLLRDLPERREGDARLKLVAEAQLLRDAKAFKEAYEVYGQAVKRFPDEPELLYDQALMAERAGMPADMERLLRELIAAKPDHHHAYNALGYALADRNERLPEAKALIEKAVALAPNDAYIQDSLGWVEFRMGNTERALSILRDAFGRRADAEIAAHLGEVLWAKGQRDEALKIWREGLFLAHDNEALQQTLQRLNVKP